MAVKEIPNKLKIDAEKFCEGIMQTFALPLEKFEFVKIESRRLAANQ